MITYAYWPENDSIENCQYVTAKDKNDACHQIAVLAVENQYFGKIRIQEMKIT